MSPAKLRPAPRGLKKQIFGAVLLGIGVFNVLAAAFLLYERDLFYDLLVLVGFFLFLYGFLEKRRHSDPST